ncbi:MAG: putative transposase [Oleiphilaceae bacterium]
MVITAFSFGSRELFVMPELAQANKNQASRRKRKSCSVNSLTPNLSLTLPALSTLNEKDCKPFWNQQCKVIHSSLWLPQKTDSPELDSSLLNGLLNYQVDRSKFWMEKVRPLNPSTQQSLLVSLPHSAIHTMANDQPKDAVILASKKIRFYPQNKHAYFDALSLYRRSYNLAVERYREGTYKDADGKFINLRPAIKAQTKQEQEASNRAYNSLISDNGTLAAKTTFVAVCKKNKSLKGAKSGFSQLNFKSRKGCVHSFSIDRLPVGLNPCVKALGKIHLTEEVPPEAIDRSCVITHDKGRWYIQVQQHIVIKADIQGDVKCVGVDQGVRKFATCFSESEALIVGADFAKDKLFPLIKKVDGLISQKQKILNSQKDIEYINMPQWAQDRIVFLNKSIDKLKCKKDDSILDLHNRLAFELVTNYDVIFLPTFKTKGMVTRKGKVRTIRRNTCRQMLDLCHYKFKLRLKWYAKKYGKIVVDCNESYTSKTRSWDGSIDEKLGGKKFIKGNGFTIDRDINGSRNILIKQLSKAA